MTFLKRMKKYMVASKPRKDKFDNVGLMESIMDFKTRFLNSRKIKVNRKHDLSCFSYNKLKRITNWN